MEEQQFRVRLVILHHLLNRDNLFTDFKVFVVILNPFSM